MTGTQLGWLFRRLTVDNFHGSISPAEFDRQMHLNGLCPEDFGQTPESVLAAKQQWWAAFVENLTLGFSSPEAFDRELLLSGCTLEDIGQTELSIAAAKRQWWVRRLRWQLSLLRVGKCTPEQFDDLMKSSGLRSQDIDETEESITGAKYQWWACVGHRLFGQSPHLTASGRETINQVLETAGLSSLCAT